MNRIVFNELTRILQEHEADLRGSKGIKYQRGSDDVHSNFKRHANRADTTSLSACDLYLTKQLDALTGDIRHINKKGVTFADLDLRVDDNIISRICDARNYLLFMATLLVEQLAHQEPALSNLRDEPEPTFRVAPPIKPGSPGAPLHRLFDINADHNTQDSHAPLGAFPFTYQEFKQVMDAQKHKGFPHFKRVEEMKKHLARSPMYCKREDSL